MAKAGATLQSTFSASELRSHHEVSPHASLDVPGLKPLLINGLQPGTITQIEGPRSSGRTALGAHILAQATGRGEICAVVDTQGHLYPESLQAAGVRLDQVVWIRCQGNPEHAMRAVDLLLHAGGFGVVWLDLCETPALYLQRIPLSSWYRFRRAIENSPTILLVNSDTACVKSSVSNSLQLKTKVVDWLGNPGVVRFVMSTATLQKQANTHPLLLQAVV